MKGSKKILLIELLFLTIIISCSFSSKGNISVTTNEIKSKSDLIDIDLKIPVIHGIKDKEFQAKLNKTYYDEAISFKDEILKEAKSFKEYAELHNIPYRPFVAYTTYKVPYNKDGLLSIVTYYYRFTGGAHGGTLVKSKNINTNTQKVILLKDLFKRNTNYKEIINKEIMKQISSNEGSYFKDSFKGIYENQPFYLENGDLVIYFQQYEIAPYAFGIPEFKIPLSIFSMLYLA